MFSHPAVHQLENAVYCFAEKYSKLPIFEKILDGMLVGAVVATFILMVLEHTLLAGTHWVEFMHHVNLALAIIFFADLLRTYRNSGHWKRFVRYHWLDITATLFMFVVFSTVYYPAAGRMSYLLRVQKLHKVTHFYHLRHMDKVLA